MAPTGLLSRSVARALAAVALVAGSATAMAAAQPAPPEAPLSPSLVRQLARAGGLSIPIMVHGTTPGAADAAVSTTGMTKLARFDRVGVVAALATPDQIVAARTRPGVNYLEGDQQLRTFTSTSHQATRSRQARQALRGTDGRHLDGSGVSIAIIDTGIDPTHPSFAGDRVVKNLKSGCVNDASTGSDCIADLPTSVDTDTGSGHGTHVAGIAAGGEVRLNSGDTVSGAAPGAKIVSISAGEVLTVINVDAALNWVLEHHHAPCGADVPVTSCPPIKVVNNSYGPAGGGPFDPNSATVKIQRQLAAAGLVTVWANGNDGGDGSADLSNPPGKDPTGGVVSVASYDDQNTGTRNGRVSSYSARGLAADPSTWPDVSAPGQNITSSCRPYLPICSSGASPQNGPGPFDVGTFNTISGTSMAAPHITGIVAQLVQANPAATPAAIENALKLTSYKFSDGAPYSAGTSFDKGYGLVDAYAAAVLLRTTPP